MKLGLIQTNTQSDIAANLAFIEAGISRLAEAGAELVLLPETFTYLGSDEDMRASAEPLAGPSLSRLRQLAREKGLFLHCGSILERRDDQIYNTSVVYDRNGNELGKYSKLHLFDIETPGGVVYKESAFVTPGDEPVVIEINGRKVGLAICYDLRFPELFRNLSARGAELVLMPAVFTLMTGKDHWEVLLRARAIENLCYVAAANNWGSCPPKHPSWGHSMVVNPWGTVIAQAADCATTLIAELDFDLLAAVRQKLPALHHRRRDIL